MTWRWNAFSMRLTPTRPSRTRSELSREGIADASSPDHVGTSDPVLEPALLAVEADPQKAQKQRRHSGKIAGTTCRAARRRRAVTVDVDDPDVEQAHAERAPEDDVE